MAVNEQIVTGRKFRKLVDEATKLWQRISFWTKASDVEFDDGLTAETKMGAINGITDSLVSTSSNIAASAKALSTLNNDLVSDIYVGTDGKLHKTKGGADTVLNFKNFQFGSVTVSGGTWIRRHISFPKSFQNVPYVFISSGYNYTGEVATNGSDVTCYPGTITPNGFDLWYSTGASSMTYYWFAFSEFPS